MTVEEIRKELLLLAKKMDRPNAEAVLLIGTHWIDTVSIQLWQNGISGREQYHISGKSFEEAFKSAHSHLDSLPTPYTTRAAFATFGL